MSSFTTVVHDVKPPKRPKITCDDELHPKLNEHPLLKGSNHSFYWLITGKPGQGKSSMWCSVLCNKDMLRQVFDKVYLFMPASSRASFDEKSMIHKLPEDQMFEDVTAENLQGVLSTIERDVEENGWRSLVIFDDVQKYLKNKSVQPLFTHMAANRRHGRTCIIVAAQTYHRVPREVRLMCSHIFTFLPTKGEQKDMLTELLPIAEVKFKEILEKYSQYLRDTGKKSFIYFNLVSPGVFLDWDHELIEKDPLEV